MAAATAPAATGAAQPAQPGRGSCSLYVGDLPTDLANPEDSLFNMFSKIGMVMSIKVCRDINTQRSLGYAYVNFQSPQDAEQALQRLNFSEIRPGRPIRVMWSIRDPSVRRSGAGNVFIKNLDTSVDNRTLHDTFAQYGTIFSCKVALDDQGKSLGYGFVQFDSDEAAKEAIAKVDGMEVGGQAISVVAFVKKAERDEEEEKVFTEVYVKNLSKDATEESVKALAEEFGEVESIFLGEAAKYESKFALVVLTKHDDAVKMIEKLHEAEHKLAQEGQKLYVARKLKKRERAAARSRTTANNLYQSQGRNVYVKHIDDSMTTEQFKDLFTQFGEITSAKLMADNDGQARGFGFVCFSTKEAAAAAIREMNGKMIGRRPLYVSQAQQRDMRHHMLDEQRKAMLHQQQRMAMNIGGPFWDQGGRGFGPGGRGFGPGRGGMMPMMGGMPFGMMPGMRGGGMPRGPRGFGGPGPMRGGFTQPQQPPMQQRHQPSELSKLPPEEQKNALGEKLYVKITELNPAQAPKITGMLLEMDIPEILNVLEDRQMLIVKVREAENVLSRHEKH